MLGVNEVTLEGKATTHAHSDPLKAYKKVHAFSRSLSHSMEASNDKIAQYHARAVSPRKQSRCIRMEKLTIFTASFFVDFSPDAEPS
jgi:hypothetical protein